MIHPNQQLAHNLINYSVKLQAGEKILIEVSDSGRELAEYLVEEVYKVGKTAGWLLKHMPRPLPHDIEFNDPYLKVEDSSSTFNLLDL